MYRPGTRRRAAMTLVLAALLVGCATDAGPSTLDDLATEARDSRFRGCTQLTDDIASTLQSFLDQFAPSDTVDGSIGAQVPTTQDLDTAADRFRRRRAALGCGEHEFRFLLGLALDEVEGSGPLARAVEAQLHDAVLPPTGPAAVVTVEPGDDLATAVHEAHPGATVRLAAGRHELEQPLVLLRPATLIGAGRDETTVVSTAPGAVLLHVGRGTFSAEGISFRHEGDEGASVVVLATGSYELRDVAMVGGAGDAEGAGWGLVLGGGHDRVEERVEVVEGLALHDNGAGGLAVVGERAPTVADVVATRNATCGVCFLGDAAGTLAQVEVRDNSVGVSIDGTSRPVLSGLTAVSNLTAGVLADGRSEAHVDDASITSDVQAGVAVRGTARLAMAEASISTQADVGIIVEADGTLELLASSVSGPSVGIAVRDVATGVLSEVMISDVTEASIVYGGNSTGSVGQLTCAADVPGIVLLDATSVELLDERCHVLDQR